MSILKNIEINKKLTMITFEELEYSYQFTIQIEKDIYKFKMGFIQNCCESFGIEYYDEFNKVKRTIQDYSSNYNLIIKNIEIIHNKERYDITLNFIFENGKNIRFGFYNYHDGFYSHRVMLQLFENGDVNPMNILNTYL